jgi:hypothetical protein
VASRGPGLSTRTGKCGPAFQLYHPVLVRELAAGPYASRSSGSLSEFRASRRRVRVAGEAVVCVMVTTYVMSAVRMQSPARSSRCA